MIRTEYKPVKAAGRLILKENNKVKGCNILLAKETSNTSRYPPFADEVGNHGVLGTHSDRILKVPINPFLNKPWFLRVCGTSLLKTPWEKKKLIVTSNFSFSHSVFYRSGELSDILIKFEIVVCKLFQFGRI